MDSPHLDGLTHYECLIKVLHEVSAEGFDLTQDMNGGICRTLTIGSNRRPAIMMLDAAMHDIDPEGELVYDKERGMMQLAFSKHFEKPPVRALRTKIDAMKDMMLNHAEFKESAGFYVVTQDLTAPFDLCEFVSHFASNEHPLCYFYRFLGTEPFVDSDGDTHLPGELVSYDTMEEFRTAHPEKNLPLTDKLEPEKVAFDAQTMQDMLEAMGFSGRKQGSNRG